MHHVELEFIKLDRNSCKIKILINLGSKKRQMHVRKRKRDRAPTYSLSKVEHNSETLKNSKVKIIGAIPIF